MDGKEIGKTDDEHDGGILHVDDVVVSDLGHDVPQRLRQDNVQHGLPVVHADGLRSLKLAWVNAHNAAPDRFCHIRAGVDGNHDNAHSPFVAEADAEEIRHAVINDLPSGSVTAYIRGSPTPRIPTGMESRMKPFSFLFFVLK